ncbi:hypothetical protein C8R45DRAFT_948071 [Mycena sanguinolenta]|nr:hypothetical protein C8R45DRAFT_948071 [Mycena sanguinolenta]
MIAVRRWSADAGCVRAWCEPRYGFHDSGADGPPLPEPKESVARSSLKDPVPNDRSPPKQTADEASSQKSQTATRRSTARAVSACSAPRFPLSLHPRRFVDQRQRLEDAQRGRVEGWKWVIEGEEVEERNGRETAENGGRIHGKRRASDWGTKDRKGVGTRGASVDFRPRTVAHIQEQARAPSPSLLENADGRRAQRMRGRRCMRRWTGEYRFGTGANEGEGERRGRAKSGWGGRTKRWRRGKEGGREGGREGRREGGREGGWGWKATSDVTKQARKEGDVPSPHPNPHRPPSSLSKVSAMTGGASVIQASSSTTSASSMGYLPVLEHPARGGIDPEREADAAAVEDARNGSGYEDVVFLRPQGFDFEYSSSPLPKRDLEHEPHAGHRRRLPRARKQQRRAATRPPATTEACPTPLADERQRTRVWVRQVERCARRGIGTAKCALDAVVVEDMRMVVEVRSAAALVQDIVELDGAHQAGCGHEDPRDATGPSLGKDACSGEDRTPRLYRDRPRTREEQRRARAVDVDASVGMKDATIEENAHLKMKERLDRLQNDASRSGLRLGWWLRGSSRLVGAAYAYSGGLER